MSIKGEILREIMRRFLKCSNKLKQNNKKQVQRLIDEDEIFVAYRDSLEYSEK